ncbi:MAG: asparagine--tRNA ligase [Mycoplasma sp.]|nr:asparagine--tRNA ligase [Mycoplasma sp.]
MKISIKEILDNNSKKYDDIQISGWIISVRGNKNIAFITLNDGSTLENIQIVVKKDEFNLEEILSYRIGASLIINGKIEWTPEREQPCEMKASKIELIKNSTINYPFQKNEFSKEVLREMPHQRHRTKIFRAVMRVRSTLFQEVHNYFAKQGYLLCNTPIITGNDGEGAGEAFSVISKANKNFFGKEASLTVTGQLHAEAYVNGFKKVYTFGPTFRAENSHTQRHAAEFWMLEPEVAFTDLENIIEITDDMLKEVIKNTIDKLTPEFKYLNEISDNTLLNKLDKVINNKVKILDYRDAIVELQKVSSRFENSEISFGIDLATEHEKYLSEEFIKGPVAITNFPKEIKAFYMYLNDDNETVAAYDILVPGIGELVGGSQRENKVDVLISRMKELNIDIKDLEWYLNIREEGYPGSAGFGLGFERLVMYVTGIDNIRDSIPFPRTPNNLLM